MGVSTPDRKVSIELRSIANELEEKLHEITGQKMNFSLLVFQSEIGSRMNYISNVKREDVVNAMESLLAGWKQGMPDIKAHKYQ